MVNLIEQDDENLKRINDAFNSLDSENTGHIRIEDLKECLPELYEQWSCQNTIEGATIDYTEFLTRAIDIKSQLSKDRVKEAFKTFCDPAKKGKITPQGLSLALKKRGREVAESCLLYTSPSPRDRG